MESDILTPEEKKQIKRDAEIFADEILKTLKNKQPISIEGIN